MTLRRSSLLVLISTFFFTLVPITKSFANYEVCVSRLSVESVNNYRRCTAAKVCINAKPKSGERPPLYCHEGAKPGSVCQGPHCGGVRVAIPDSCAQVCMIALVKSLNKCRAMFGKNSGPCEDMSNGIHKNCMTRPAVCEATRKSQ